jgi:predicted acetyltransferase
MRVGSAVIRAGAIGYTATHPEHRRQGLAAALMEDWTRELTQSGEHVSFIVGIPNFYEQFGYEFSFPLDIRDSPVSIDLSQLSNEETGTNVRQFEENDIPILAALYDKENATRTGSLVRTDEYWEWLLRGLHDSGRIKRGDIWLVEDSDQQPLGYAMLHPGPLDELEVWEAAAAGEDVAAALLSAVAAKARLEGSRCIDLKLPLDHLVTRKALSQGAYVSAYSSGVYARLLDLHSLFEAMQPELERRLRCSSQAEWQGTLRLATDVGTVYLAITDRKLEVGGRVSPIHKLEVPQSLLVKLVTGYTSVRWVAGVLNVQWMAGLANARIEQGLWPIMQALFPKGCPYIWNADIGY